MKKTIYLLLTALLTLSLVGCGADSLIKGSADTPVETEAPTETEAPAEAEAADPYEAIIARYKTAVAEHWDASQMMENGLNYMLPGCLEQDERARVGYYEGDLNGDGQPELAIAAASESEYYTGMIFVLYTLEDEQPAVLAESGERDRWYYAGEGRLYNEGSSGAAESRFALCAADRTLAYLDAVEYDGLENPDEPWQRYTGKAWEPISEEEADAALQKLKSTVTNLEIIPF